MWDAYRGSWHNLENTSGSVGEDVVEIRAWRAKTRGSICCIFNLLIGVFYDTSSHFRLIVVYCYFFLFCSLSALCCACLPSGLLFTSFCCPSTGHFHHQWTDRTTISKQQPFVPSRLGLLPERMFVFVHFFIFLSPCHFSLLATRYVPGISLLLLLIER